MYVFEQCLMAKNACAPFKYLIENEKVKQFFFVT